MSDILRSRAVAAAVGNGKHTPGPWKPHQMVAPGRAWDGQWEIHWSNDGECVAEIVFYEADAHLIAASPNLLERLTELVSLAEMHTDNSPGNDLFTEILLCKEAIAQAHGTTTVPQVAEQAAKGT